MEMAGSETSNVPKSYILNMSKDFVPMSVFSETSQGKVLIHIFWFYLFIYLICLIDLKYCSCLLLGDPRGIELLGKYIFWSFMLVAVNLIIFYLLIVMMNF